VSLANPRQARAAVTAGHKPFKQQVPRAENRLENSFRQPQQARRRQARSCLPATSFQRTALEQSNARSRALGLRAKEPTHRGRLPFPHAASSTSATLAQRPCSSWLQEPGCAGARVVAALRRLSHTPRNPQAVLLRQPRRPTLGWLGLEIGTAPALFQQVERRSLLTTRGTGPAALRASSKSPALQAGRMIAESFRPPRRNGRPKSRSLPRVAWPIGFPTECRPPAGALRLAPAAAFGYTGWNREGWAGMVLRLYG